MRGRGDRHRFGSSDAHDSAGQPWAGRSFQPNARAGDDGTADPALLAALAAFRAGESGQGAVVEALRGVRLLVPLLAEAGEVGLTPEGRVVDKTQELSLVTVRTPTGRTAIPAFTSVAAMQAWNALARPVPVEAERVALAAGAEGSAVILDATTPDEFGLQRAALAALATGAEWLPPWLDEAVLGVFAAALVEPELGALDVLPGDPEARLTGPEVTVRLAVRPGLDRAGLDGLLARIQQHWSAGAETIAARLESYDVKLVAFDG